MDKFAKDQAFNYVLFLNQPANLVVSHEGPRHNKGPESTGEPISLAGRISKEQMGTYAGREKPPQPKS